MTRLRKIFRDMTLEENQKLKEKLMELGYYIQLYPDKPEQWSAKLYDKINGDEEVKNLMLTIVDCSYEGMNYIKIRTRIHGTFYTIAERLSMKECSVDYVLSLVGPANIQIKMMLNRERLEKIDEDF